MSSFPAHGVHQGNLHAGELDAGRHQVHALGMVQNALAGRERLVRKDLTHHVREGNRQTVRLSVAQADGKTGLGVVVEQENLFPLLRKSHAQICAGSGLADPALLIGYGDNLSVHGFTSFLNSICFGNGDEKRENTVLSCILPNLRCSIYRFPGFP